MGKGHIISGGTDGLYQVQIQHNLTRHDAMVADLEKKKTDLEENRVEPQAERDALAPQITEARALLLVLTEELTVLYESLSLLLAQASPLMKEIKEIKDDISRENDDKNIFMSQAAEIEQEYPETYEENEDWITYQNNIIVLESNIDVLQNELAAKEEELAQVNSDIHDTKEEISEKETEVEEKMTEAMTLVYDLELLDQRLSAIDLDIAAIEKRLAYLAENLPEDETISAWCADLTEDLSGSVGTVEVPGEKQVVQIQPGYEGNAAYNQTRDGQLFPTVAMTPAQAFYNFAMMPGWQKWKPIFRYGTITAIADGLASVTLDASMVSGAQDLGINQTATLAGVAFEYMSCDDAAFTEGDEVLIMFTNQEFESPKIIGFKEEPKECCTFQEFWTDGTWDIDYWRHLKYSSPGNPTPTAVIHDLGSGDSKERYCYRVAAPGGYVYLYAYAPDFAPGEDLTPNWTFKTNVSNTQIHDSSRGYVASEINGDNGSVFIFHDRTSGPPPTNLVWEDDVAIYAGEGDVAIDMSDYVAVMGEGVYMVRARIYRASADINNIMLCPGAS